MHDIAVLLAPPLAFPLCRFSALPLFRFAALPLCRFAALPLCRFAALPLCQQRVTFSGLRPNIYIYKYTYI